MYLNLSTDRRQETIKESWCKRPWVQEGEQNAFFIKGGEEERVTEQKGLN